MIDTAAFELVKSVLSALIPTVVATLAAAIALPLTRRALLVSVIASCAVLAAILLNRVAAVWVAVIPALLGLIAAFQWRMLGRTVDIIFLISVDSPWREAAILNRRGFGLELALCPISVLAPLKRRIIRRLVGRQRARVIDLAPERVGDRYRCASPTERALAKIANPKNIQRQRLIYISFLSRNSNITLEQPGNMFRASADVCITTLPLLTDILSGGPGAFGFISEAPPSLSDWAPLCAMEAMTAGASTMDFPALITELRTVAEQSGRLEYFIAYLTIRLRAFGQRYGPRIEIEDCVNVFETAVIGNLRTVALEFNQRHIGDEFQRSIWFTNLLYALFDYIAGTTVYARAGHAGPVSNEMSWLVALMVRFVHVEKDGKFYIPLDDGKRTNEVDNEALVEAANSGDPARAMKAMMAAIQPSEIPASVSEEAEARRIVRLSSTERDDAAKAWIEAVPRQRDYRCWLLIDALNDVQGEAVRGYLQRFMDAVMTSLGSAEETGSDGRQLLTQIQAQIQAMATFSKVQLGFCAMFGDPLASAAIEGKYHAESKWLAIIAEQFAAVTSTLTRDNITDFLGIVIKLLPAAWRPWVHVAQGMPSIHRASPAFLSTVVKPGIAYSDDELFYSIMMLMLAFDTESPPETFSRAIAKMEEVAIGLIRNDDVVDRASVLWLSAELLRSDRPVISGEIEGELRAAGLPPPTWWGQLIQ